MGTVASLTCRGLLSTLPSGSPKAAFPSGEAMAFPPAQQGVGREADCPTNMSSLTLSEPISQGFYSSQPFPRYSHLSLTPPCICAASQRHWDPCIFLAQNCTAGSSYNLENTKASQGAGKKKTRGQATHNHNKKQSIRLYKLVYIQFTMWFCQLFVQFKQQSKWTSQMQML